MYPFLLKFDHITIYTVSVFHTLALYVGAVWVYVYSIKAGMDKDKIMNLITIELFLAVFGARVFSILFDGYIEQYLAHPIEMFELWRGGFTFYGGFVFGLAGGIWYIKKHKLDIWRLADLFAPALALGLSIGRIGCFMSGDSYGKPTNLPWAVTFTNPNSMAPTGVPLHPTQIYSVISNLSIFIFLLFWKKRQKFTGELFIVFLILYSITRSFIEIFRNDPRGVYFNGMISTSQIISIIVIVAAILFYYKENNSMKHELKMK